jgi:hypothetical protein
MRDQYHPHPLLRLCRLRGGNDAKSARRIGNGIDRAFASPPVTLYVEAANKICGMLGTEKLIGQSLNYIQGIDTRQSDKRAGIDDN